MKLEHLVGLAVRLFAIVLAIYTTQNAIVYLPYLYEQDWGASLYFYLALTVSILILSLYLWYFPLTVSSRLVNFRGSGATDAAAATAPELQVIALTILGIYLLLQALSDSLYWLSLWFLTQRMERIPLHLTTDQISSIFVTLFEFVVALVLVFGAHGVSDLVRRIRGR